MAEAREGPITLLAMGDELLLSIMELLCMADVLSCSLVSHDLTFLPHPTNPLWT